MKKSISILLAITICLTAAACSKSEDDNSSVATETWTETIIIENETSQNEMPSTNDNVSSDEIASSEDTPIRNTSSKDETSSNDSDTLIDDFLNEEQYTAKNYAYSFAVVGDTQYLVQNDVNWGVNNTAILYDWIVANKDAKKIKAVFGLGDITEKNDPLQWQHAKNNISKLNGILPYYLVRGNHDSSDSLNLHFNLSAYTSQFTDPDISDQSKCFYQKAKIENSYTKFTVGNTKYLVLMLDFRAYDNVLEWANEVVAANPDNRVIVTTHDYLGVDGSWDTEKDYIEENCGRDIWVEFIRKHKNIFLVLCGHISKYPNSDIIKFEREGDNGNSVTQLMINAQSLEWDDITTTADDNAQQYGMVAMLYFNEDGSEVTVDYIWNFHFERDL
jgi:3',5'-cyclic AMP phosphodiesterase CpdA